MSTAELEGTKLELIGWISNLSDEELIKFLDSLRISREKGDWWEELSLFQRKQILAGIKDADDGKIIDSKKFWETLKDA